MENMETVPTSMTTYDEMFAWFGQSPLTEIESRIKEMTNESERCAYALMLGIHVNNPDIVRYYSQLVDINDLLQPAGNITSLLQYAMKCRKLSNDNNVNFKKNNFHCFFQIEMERPKNQIVNVLLDEGISISGDDYLIASYYGIEEIVSDYLYRGENICYKSDRRIEEYNIFIDDNALIIATESNQHKIVQLLLSNKTSIVSDYNLANIALCNACGSRNSEIVKLLISDSRHEDYINYKDEKGYTALIYAASCTDNNRVVELLVRKYSCDINIATNDGLTALICIMSHKKPDEAMAERIRILKIMIRRNVQISGIEFLLACAKGYECIVDAYIARGGNPHIMVQSVPTYDEWPYALSIRNNTCALWNACNMSQNICVIRSLLSSGSYGMKQIGDLDMLEDWDFYGNRSYYMHTSAYPYYEDVYNPWIKEIERLKIQFIDRIWDRRKYFLIFLLRNNHLDPAVTQRVMGKLSKKARKHLNKIPITYNKCTAMTKVYQMQHLVFIRDIMSFL